MSAIDWLMLIVAGGVAGIVWICVLVMLQVIEWLRPITDELT